MNEMSEQALDDDMLVDVARNTLCQTLEYVDGNGDLALRVLLLAAAEVSRDVQIYRRGVEISNALKVAVGMTLDQLAPEPGGPAPAPTGRRSGHLQAIT